MPEKPVVKVQDLGLIDYKQAWDFQEELLKEAVDLKISNRKNDTNFNITHTLLLRLKVFLTYHLYILIRVLCPLSFE